MTLTNLLTLLATTPAVTQRAKTILTEQLTELPEEHLTTAHEVRTLTGRLQPQRMVEGNAKIKGNTLVFSLTPGRSCPNCTDCIKSCYAMKAYVQYDASKNAWDINTDLAETNLPLLEALLKAQILDRLQAKTEQLYVRIHVAGDFLSQAYVDMWERIAKTFPTVLFWTYTKTAWDFSAMPTNVNIIDSYIDGQINYGPIEYVMNLVEHNGAFLCPATVPGAEVKCVKDCKYCVTGRKPVFIEH